MARSLGILLVFEGFFCIQFTPVLREDELTNLYCNSTYQVQTFIFIELLSKYQEETSNASFQQLLQNFFQNSQKICEHNKNSPGVKFRINRYIFLTEEQFH